MSKDNTVYTGANFWERNRRSGGYLLKKRFKQISISVIRGLLMFGLCFMIIQPIVTRFSMSFMEERDLYDSTIVMLPRHVTLENYKFVADLTGFPESMLNTLWISFVMSLCQVVSTTLVAYGFARFDFPLKKFWFGCVVALIIIPPQTIQSALYMTFSRFDILGIFKAATGSTLSIRTSIWPYIMMCLTCMGLKDGLYIYMLRQYFKGVPESLEEAAYVDGCSTMHTFVKIMLPDALPVIASCFLFSFVWQWTDLFYSRNFLSGYKLFAVQMSTMTTRMGRYFSTSLTDAITVTNGRSLQLISIAVLFCCIPLIILYCFTQRTFVESLAMTGSKE